MLLAERGLKWVKMIESEQNWMEVSPSELVHVPDEGGLGLLLILLLHVVVMVPRLRN